MNHLVAFVKHPELGKVKTRLAADIGNGPALAIYKKMLVHLRDAILEVKAVKKVYYGEKVIENDQWTGHGLLKYPQKGKDIGEKMAHAFTECFTDEATKVLLVGGDCPGVYPELFKKGFELLGQHDLVLGPAYDGGYYLIGLKAPHPEVFENISWSTGKVLEQTLSQAQKSGLSTALVDRLYDVDTLEDLKKYGWEY